MRPHRFIKIFWSLAAMVILGSAFSLSAVAASANKCSRPLSQLALTPNDFGHMVGFGPVNEMSEDFQTIFGNYITKHTAGEKSLRAQAKEIFLERLALSNKYQTKFVDSVEPKDKKGKAFKIWQARLSGKLDKTIWSFGFKNHVRADEIWKALHKNLDLEQSTKQFTEAPFASGMANVWTFHYPTKIQGKPLNFKIYGFNETQDFFYFLEHAKSKSIPGIFKRLNVLWGRSLDPQRELSSRIRNLAEFEWLWFWTNPFARAGASTGMILSTLCQKTLLQEGHPIKMRRDYIPQDLEALSRPLAEYISLRSQELL